MYDGLREHAGWRHLLKKIREQEEALWTPIVNRLKKGELIEQRELDHHRGFIEGAIFAVTHPEVAEANLELAARLAWSMGLMSLESEEEPPNA